MAEKVIFAEQTLSFVYSEGFGAYYTGLGTSPFSLVDGQEYIVVWDGIENKRTAFAFTNPRDGSSCVALGNPLVTGGAANEDSFAIVEDKTNGYAYFFSLETTAEHTIKILQTEAEGIIIKDRSGKSNVYKGVETVTFDTDVEGIQQTFSKGNILEGAEFELDFSEGDQKANVPEGFLVKEATIKKPEALIPENIAEGIDIAGIIGTFAGGAEPLIAFGTFQTSAGRTMVEHNLGVVPDVFIACAQSSSGTLSNLTTSVSCPCLIGLSKAMKNKMGVTYSQYAVKPGGSTKISLECNTYGIEEGGSSRIFYSKATEKYVYAGSTDYSKLIDIKYIWFAIGGLT